MTVDWKPEIHLKYGALQRVSVLAVLALRGRSACHFTRLPFELLCEVFGFIFGRRNYSCPIAPVIHPVREPGCIAVTSDGDITVADGSELRVIDPNSGALIRKIPLAFRPTGLAYHGDGTLLISNFGRDRVVARHADGSEAVLCARGTRPGRVMGPRGLAVTAVGDIVVAEELNHRVQILRRDGTALRVIERDPQLQPARIAVSRTGFLAVPEANLGRVQIFRLDGSSVCQLNAATEQLPLQQPEGVAFDHESNLVISDNSSYTYGYGHRSPSVLVFSLREMRLLLQERAPRVDEPDDPFANYSQGSWGPTGVAVLHDGRIVVVDTKHQRLCIV